MCVGGGGAYRTRRVLVFVMGERRKGVLLQVHSSGCGLGQGKEDADVKAAAAQAQRQLLFPLLHTVALTSRGSSVCVMSLRRARYLVGGGAHTEHTTTTTASNRVMVPLRPWLRCALAHVPTSAALGVHATCTRSCLLWFPHTPSTPKPSLHHIPYNLPPRDPPVPQEPVCLQQVKHGLPVCPPVRRPQAPQDGAQVGKRLGQGRPGAQRAVVRLLTSICGGWWVSGVCVVFLGGGWDRKRVKAGVQIEQMQAAGECARHRSLAQHAHPDTPTHSWLRHLTTAS